MSYIDARDHDRSGNHKKQQRSPLATTSISTVGKSADNGTSSGTCELVTLGIPRHHGVWNRFRVDFCG